MDGDCKIVSNVGDMLKKTLRESGSKFLLAPPMLLINVVFPQEEPAIDLNAPPGFQPLRFMKNINPDQVCIKQTLMLTPDLQCQIPGREKVKTAFYKLTGFIKDFKFQTSSEPTLLEKGVSLIAYKREFL